MKRILLLTLFCLLIVNLVSAATDTQVVSDVFKLNEIISYAKPCFNNGSYCSAAAQCNYTIFNPDNSIYLDNVKATNKGTYHNISFAVSKLGIYKADMVCCDGVECGSESLYFEVTGSGFNNTLGFYVIILLISAGIIAMGFLIKDGWVTVIGTLGLYFIGLYILFNGLVGIKDTTTTWAIGIIILGIAGYLSVNSAWEMITE